MSDVSTPASGPQKKAALVRIPGEGFKPALVPAVEGFRLLGIGPTTGWGFIKCGKLEVVHVGTRCFVTVESIENLIDELRAAEATRSESRAGLKQATEASVVSRRFNPPKRRQRRMRRALSASASS
jgi:hypothetical protein